MTQEGHLLCRWPLCIVYEPSTGLRQTLPTSYPDCDTLRISQLVNPTVVILEKIARG